MDYFKLPLGFGLALAANFNAMNAYSALTEEERRSIVDKAHNARSEAEMHDLVAALAASQLP